MSQEKISEREERVRKTKELKKIGIDPYPAKAKRSHLIKAVLDNFDKLEKGKTSISIAGRLRAKRSHGNLSFLRLIDSSGEIQIAVSKNEINAGQYKIISKLIDVGDFISVSGACFVTQKGERSIMAQEWQLLTKAIRPLPDKWHGLKDEEEKLRKRYLDILFNEKSREIISKRAMFWQSTRQFMLDKGFNEVETPVLEVTTGGADARPFITHHNALDIDVYLRISMGELWQKRLMVAGLEKTFEIGRQFRNEGMDAEHLQDYTQMEFYWAYADYEDGMALVEELYKHIAKKVFGTYRFKINDFTVDLDKPWERYNYRDTVLKYTGVDINKASINEIEKKLKELKVEYSRDGWNITRAIDNLWKYCRKNIAGPGFLIGVPLTVSPLAKKMPGQEGITQRFQPIIAGSELGNGYSELNDPVDQAERFAAQQKLREAGDTEAQMYDHEFVQALEYGMPPTCGYGMSERVFSFLMNKTARECQIFPLMKPKSHNLQPVTHSETESEELGINYNGAKKLLDANIKDPISKLHMIESEAIMRALAAHLDEDEEKWGIIGLLHDIDWEETKNNIRQHCVRSIDILKEAGATEFLINTIISHAFGNKECGDYADKTRITRLEHLLAAAETLTGLIAAAALVQPDKKLKSVKLKSLKKKFKQKAFAANCDRDIIMECEQAGIPLGEFLAIGLKAMQDISDKLGL